MTITCESSKIGKNSTKKIDNKGGHRSWGTEEKKEVKSLFPLSWGKTIYVGCGSAPKIIEVMLQRPYGVRGLVSLRFSRHLWRSSKMSCG